jgi:hypothetical protein
MIRKWGNCLGYQEILEVADLGAGGRLNAGSKPDQGGGTCHQAPLLNLFARYSAIPDNTVSEITIMLAFDQSPLPALV